MYITKYLAELIDFVFTYSIDEDGHQTIFKWIETEAQVQNFNSIKIHVANIGILIATQECYVGKKQINLSMLIMAVPEWTGFGEDDWLHKSWVQ